MREVDAAVSDLGGLKGRALGIGLAGANKVRPGFLESQVFQLLPVFAESVDPHFEAGKAAGDVKTHFRSNASAVADSMLFITDRRAGNSKNKVAVTIYKRLRGSAEDQVVSNMDRISGFVERHAA